MKRVGVSRLAIMIAVAGTIFASSASGCVVHERTVRWSPHPYPVVKVVPAYPVIVHRHPKHHWYAGRSPQRWFRGCDKRGHDCRPRYQVDGRGRGHDHHHRGRLRDFDG